MAQSNTSDKSRGIALALATVIGPFGGHRFYVGKIGTGLLQLVTFGGMGIWWLYDWILVLAGGFRDIEGRRLANWGEEGEGLGVSRLDNEKLELLLDEIDRLRSEMGDLDERMDFMERMLANARDRGAIPPGPGSI
jgi:TM2 domain-containing membrane protein YozV